MSAERTRLSQLSVHSAFSVPRSYLRSALVLRAGRALLPLALVAAGALGILLGVLLLVHGPTQERLMQSRAAYEAVRQALSQLQAARRTQEDLGAVWQTLPARKEFAALILAVSELAKQNQVAVPGMTYSFQKMEEGQAFKASMAFQAAGEYAAIRRFIHRLETAGPYLVIESLDATRSQRAGRVAFNVRIITFLKPDPPSTGGGV